MKAEQKLQLFLWGNEDPEVKIQIGFIKYFFEPFTISLTKVLATHLGSPSG